ncbi:hypothetical protein EUTSA_v10005441mg, partial [Eutrema salsugineum]
QRRSYIKHAEESELQLSAITNKKNFRIQILQMSTLEALPQDVLGDILSRVAQSSRRDVQQCMTVSSELAEAANDTRVYNKLNLKPLAMNPLTTLNKYKALMVKCLDSGNGEAHYIEGIKEYFYYNNDAGLHHLRLSAANSYEDGIYLYGLIMFCRGEIEEGKKYLDMLQWQKSKIRADHCWRNNKISLRGIHVIKKALYRNTMRNNKPPRRCNLNDMDTRCKKCYYYKQMKKFMNHN